MKWIVDELLKGQRAIITNLALRWDPWVSGAGVANCGLRHYLRSKFKVTAEGVEHIGKRIVVVQDDQCFEFWRFRPGCVECAKTGSGFDTSAALGSGPALYVVDECWQFFSSRFSKATEQIQFYAAQHRKFGDDVVLVTQSTKQIMPALRELGQDFTVIRNHGKERIGIFRQPAVFVADTYTEPPGPTSKAMSTTPFTLDRKGLAQCYDTSSGVGIIAAGAADVHERKKGLSWVWILVGLGVIFCALISIPFWTKKATMHYFGQFDSKMKHTSMSSVLDVVKAREIEVQHNGSVSNIVERSAVQQRWLTGICWSAGKGACYFSDGDSYRTGDAQLWRLGSDFAVVDGVLYKLRFRPRETIEAKKGAEAPVVSPRR